MHHNNNVTINRWNEVQSKFVVTAIRANTNKMCIIIYFSRYPLFYNFFFNYSYGLSFNNLLLFFCWKMSSGCDYF